MIPFSRLLPGLGLLVLAGAAACNAESPGNAHSTTTLTLLGTAGGPGGNVERAGIASLVDVDGHRYLVDAGESVARQLARAGLSENQIPIVFLTHLHDDHTAGLPAVMSFAWTKRPMAMTIIGPPQTDAFVQGSLAFLAANAEIRRSERHLEPPADFITARDVDTGVVYEDEFVTVTAVENTHYHFAEDALAARNKSYSYRFETPDRIIVFTGDTGPSENVETLAEGADILVAEMVTEAGIANVPPDVREHMATEHLLPADVGKLAVGAGVGMLVLSHIRHVADDDVAEIGQYFDGAIVVGSDLDEF